MTEQKTYSVDNPDLFLNRFYEAYRLFVYNEAWKYCDKLPNVEDLVQEVWLRLCRKGEQLATYSKKQQCAYIAVVVRNTAISMTQENVETVLLDDMGDVAYDGDAAMIGFLDKKNHVNPIQRSVATCSGEGTQPFGEKVYSLGI